MLGRNCGYGRFSEIASVRKLLTSVSVEYMRLLVGCFFTAWGMRYPASLNSREVKQVLAFVAHGPGEREGFVLERKRSLALHNPIIHSLPAVPHHVDIH